MEERMKDVIKENASEDIGSQNSEANVLKPKKKKKWAFFAIVVAVIIAIICMFSEEESTNAPYGRTFGITQNEVVHSFDDAISSISIEKCNQVEEGEVEGYKVKCYSYIVSDTVGFQLVTNEDDEVYEARWLYDESCEDINDMLAYATNLFWAVTNGKTDTDEIIHMFASADSGAGPQYFDGIEVSMTSENGVGSFYFIAFDSKETFDEHIGKNK